MYEQRRHFVGVVEDEAVAPGNDCARKRTMRETVTCYEECSVAGEEPNVDEVEDGAVVAEVEEEVVPCAFFVVVGAEGEEDPGVEGVGDVHPSVGGRDGVSVVAYVIRISRDSLPSSTNI